MVQTIQISMMNEIIEVNLRENIINKSTIRSAFFLEDEAKVSLTFEIDGRKVFCQVNEINTAFELPDGWPNILFYARSDKLPSRVTTPIVQTLIERPISPYYQSSLPDPAPTSDAFIQWMFFLHDETGKATTVCVHPRFFVTYRHGNHANMNLGDASIIYRADKEINEQVGIDVSVVKIDEILDFILLKSNYDVVERGPPIPQVKNSEPYTLAGFNDSNGSLTFLPGTVLSVDNHYDNGENRKFGLFILGSSPSSRGDSGGGVWSARGLIGINIGCTSTPLQLHHLAISEAAIFNVKNIISPARDLKKALRKELEKERKEKNLPPPPQKKTCHITEIDGLGTLYSIPF